MKKTKIIYSIDELDNIYKSLPINCKIAVMLYNILDYKNIQGYNKDFIALKLLQKYDFIIGVITTEIEESITSFSVLKRYLVQEEYSLFDVIIIDDRFISNKCYNNKLLYYIEGKTAFDELIEQANEDGVCTSVLEKNIYGNVFLREYIYPFKQLERLYIIKTEILDQCNYHIDFFRSSMNLIGEDILIRCGENAYNLFSKYLDSYRSMTRFYIRDLYNSEHIVENFLGVGKYSFNIKKESKDKILKFIDSLILLKEENSIGLQYEVRFKNIITGKSATDEDINNNLALLNVYNVTYDYTTSCVESILVGFEETDMVEIKGSDLTIHKNVFAKNITYISNGDLTAIITGKKKISDFMIV